MQECSGQKNTIGFLGMKYACLDTVCSNYIWSLFYICEIFLQDGLLKDVVGQKRLVFLQNSPKAGRNL